MSARIKVCLAAVVLGVLLLPSGAWAGTIFSGRHVPAECPRPSYSPIHYWAPYLIRVRDHFRSSRLSPVAVDYHPDVPAPQGILKYRCPAIPPAAAAADRQTLP
jgi:hypothetical protein